MTNEKKPIRLLLVPVDGPTERIETVRGETGDAINKGVGGYFECYNLAPKLDMWGHDEGKLIGLAWNPRAQFLWDTKFGPGTDYIVGPVVLSGGVDRHGNTLGLSDAQLTELEALFNN